jgi:hypothetical protein
MGTSMYARLSTLLGLNTRSVQRPADAAVTQIFKCQISMHCLQLYVFMRPNLRLGNFFRPPSSEESPLQTLPRSIASDSFPLQSPGLDTWIFFLVVGPKPIATAAFTCWVTSLETFITNDFANRVAGLAPVTNGPFLGKSQHQLRLNIGTNINRQTRYKIYAESYLAPGQ